MPEMPRGAPTLPWGSLLLLGPVLPTSLDAVACDSAVAAECLAAAAGWGIPSGGTGGAGSVVLTSSVAEGVASGAETVLLDGDDNGELAAAGYHLHRWSVTPGAGGAVLLSRDDAPVVRRARAEAGRARVRAAGVAAVRRTLGGRRQLVVGSRAAGPPALAATVGATTAWLLAGGGGPRRRPVLLLGSGHGAPPDRVLKVSRPAEHPRGLHEQEVLRGVHSAGCGAPVPQPLGSGLAGPFGWTCESAVRGRPLADLLAERPPTSRLLPLLEALAAWLGRLAAATAVPAYQPRSLALADLYGGLPGAAQPLSGVPGILVHGDLGAAFNIHVDGTSCWVLDWETSFQGGPPLADLLPLLCGALASRYAPGGAATRATYVLSLCAGREAQSPWFLRTVARYLRTVGVPPLQAGALAGLAFGYQASMRLLHAQLVRDAGGDAVDWESPWDHVAARWWTRDGLGADWRALALATDV